MDRPYLSWRAYVSRLSFWFATILFLAALFLAAMGAIDIRHAVQLSRDGIDTRGTVVDHHITTARRRNGSQQRNHYIVVRFARENGETVDTVRGVSEAEYDTLAIGSTQAIRYSASSPEINELEPGATRRHAMVLLAGMLVTGMFGLWAAIATWRSLAAQRRAAQTGERRMARVVAHHGQGRRSSKAFVAEWLDSAGLTGRTPSAHESKLPAIGEEIPVYVDPRSGRGFWQGEY